MRSAIYILTISLALAIGLVPVVAQQRADDVIEQFRVEHRHIFGSCNGTLTITEDGVIYNSHDQREHSRNWSFADIEKVSRPAPTMFEVTTFEDTALRLGGNRHFKFTLKDKPMSDRTFAFVADKVRPGPIGTEPGRRTAGERERRAQAGIEVAPGVTVPATFDAMHDHAVLGNCNGTLVVERDRLVYSSTDQPEHSRTWEYANIRGLEQQGPNRLIVRTFEDELFGLGGNKDYEFVVKGAGIPKDLFRFMVDRLR